MRNHASVDFGSPPQVRGKRRDNHHKAQGVRITPAGAGKTAVVKQAAAIAWDHPRRCGENYITYDPDLLAQGSPPQVRGKLSFLSSCYSSSRITPAGAGKTQSTCQARPRDRDHPRRCGENSQHSAAKTEARGSPPQVRGKPKYLRRTLPHQWITPAGAGKT